MLKQTLLALFLGPVLAIVLAVFVLTRTQVLGYIRSSSWLGVSGWWLIAALPWILLSIGQPVYIFEANWFMRLLVPALMFSFQLLLLTLPLLTLGGTVIWLISRLRGPDIATRGA